MQLHCSKRPGHLKIILQFLEHHKDQYLELPCKLEKSDFAPQSEAALQNFKTLVELGIILLKGCNIKWAEPSYFAAPAAAGPARGADSATAAAAAGAAAARGEVAAATKDPPDAHDFTTLTRDTWDQVDFSQIRFFIDPYLSICCVWPYHAAALLL
jgi:hypothetical protein